MKKKGFLVRARRVAEKIAPVVQVAAEAALKETRRNIWEQRKTIAERFVSEVKDSRGIVDTVVVKSIERQREIFSYVDHREAMMAGLIGGLIGILNHLKKKQSPQ